MDELQIFNGLEAAWWMVCGALVLVRTSRAVRPHRRLGVVAGVTFLLFGLSDIIEVSTGAWWRPWPLLLLKAICVSILILCGIQAYRFTR